MALWETVLAATVPVTVTSAALIFQQYRADKKERMRREDEARFAAALRQEQREAEDRAREHRLQDEWREQRRAAHAALLAELDRDYALLHEAVLRAPYWSPADTPVRYFDREVNERLRQLSADMMLISHSDRAMETGEQAVYRLASLEFELSGRHAREAMFPPQEDGASRALPLITGLHDDYRFFRKQYGEAARLDIGLPHSQASRDPEYTGGVHVNLVGLIGQGPDGPPEDGRAEPQRRSADHVEAPEAAS